MDALKLGTTAAGWVCFEEGMKRLGEPGKNMSEIVAGAGTAGVFSLACEPLPHSIFPRHNFADASSQTACRRKLLGELCSSVS